MGHIEISADDHRLHLLELLDEGAKSIIPDQAVVQTGQAPLGIGCVNIGEEKESYSRVITRPSRSCSSLPSPKRTFKGLGLVNTAVPE